jgi:hypothetical protein
MRAHDEKRMENVVGLRDKFDWMDRCETIRTFGPRHDRGAHLLMFESPDEDAVLSN